jgi:hypothetical protein
LCSLRWHCGRDGWDQMPSVKVNMKIKVYEDVVCVLLQC